MKFIAHFILQIFANISAILAANYFIKGFSFSGDFKELALAGAILGGINLLVKPILRLALGPLIILTFGLFTIVINMFILYLATLFVPSVEIILGLPLLYASLIISFSNFIIHFAAKSFGRK